MGGNALKIVKTRRYNSKEYNHLIIEISKLLNENNIDFNIPLSYNLKKSHGDLDVLIRNFNIKNIDNKNLIQKIFNPKEIVVNTNCISFDYKEFQVDFIFVEASDWEPSKIYFSYNDLGNLMGRIAYSLGFRYGHFGLKYTTYYLGKKYSFIISNEPEKIFKFLGFDWNTYLNGFNTLEDTFKYVINSKYFNAKIFDYENLNHQNRTRNKKRVNYNAFLNYINNNFSLEEKIIDKEHFKLKAENYFKIDITNKINQWKKNIDFIKKASEKFNGNIIMNEFPILKGKKLGDAIKNYKKSINENLLLNNIKKENVEVEYNKKIVNTDINILLKEFKQINNL